MNLLITPKTYSKHHNGLPPTLAVSVCSSAFGRLHSHPNPPTPSSPPSNFSVAFSSLVFFHIISSLSLLTTSPSTSTPTFSAHFATLSAGCRVQNKPWLHLKLLTESTPPCFLGIMFPESLCLKSCFGLCLDSSTVYSINNYLKSGLFGSTAIRLGYIHLRVSTLHRFLIMVSCHLLTQVKDEMPGWLF